MALLSALLAAGYFIFSAYPPSASDRRAKLGKALSAELAPLPVAPDELFFPEEPDLLPPIMLSRERRAVWTEEDARPFWTDPSGLDPAPVQNAAAAAIDALFADIP